MRGFQAPIKLSCQPSPYPLPLNGEADRLSRLAVTFYLIATRPEQAQTVEDYDDCAAFVADHAGSEINLFCQRGDDQEEDLRQEK